MSATPAAIPDWVAHRAAAAPDRIALLADGRQWTFAELDRDATTMAQRIAARGVRPGDRVAALLHNGAAFAVLVHATLRLGATLVPLNIRLTAPELAWQLADATPRLLLVDHRTVALAGHALAALAALAPVSVPEPCPVDALTGDADGSVALRLAHDPVHVLAIIYTSGTTGRPKGAMLTVGNFWWSALGSGLNLGTHDDDRWLACLPLFHVGGLSIVLRSAIYGTVADVHDGFDAATVNDAIDTNGVTIVSVVAVMLDRMLDARADKPYPPTLRCVLLGGGPAPAALLRRCAAIGVPVMQTYGLTETTSQVATLAPRDAARKRGSAGKVLYPNSIRVVTDAGGEADVDAPGEIHVRGPVVMWGYLGDEQATARAVHDGWLHTGDVGRIDADGYLYVLDRRDDLIITGGENVYPAEVEAVLLSHPDVAEAGVVGVDDAAWGQRIVAVVHLAASHRGSDAHAADALRAHCRAQLAGYKSPVDIRIVASSLPRTASGKLRRNLLREIVNAPPESPSAP